jgi:hypothetical protein
MGSDWSSPSSPSGGPTLRSPCRRPQSRRSALRSQATLSISSYLPTSSVISLSFLRERCFAADRCLCDGLPAGLDLLVHVGTRYAPLWRTHRPPVETSVHDPGWIALRPRQRHLLQRPQYWSVPLGSSGCWSRWRWHPLLVVPDHNRSVVDTRLLSGDLSH